MLLRLVSVCGWVSHYVYGYGCMYMHRIIISFLVNHRVSNCSRTPSFLTLAKSNASLIPRQAPRRSIAMVNPTSSLPTAFTNNPGSFKSAPWSTKHRAIANWRHLSAQHSGETFPFRFPVSLTRAFGSAPWSSSIVAMHTCPAAIAWYKSDELPRPNRVFGSAPWERSFRTSDISRYSTARESGVMLFPACPESETD